MEGIEKKKERMETMRRNCHSKKKQYKNENEKYLPLSQFFSSSSFSAIFLYSSHHNTSSS